MEFSHIPVLLEQADALAVKETAFMLTAQRAEAVTAVKSPVDLRASSFRLIRIPMAILTLIERFKKNEN